MAKALTVTQKTVASGMMAIKDAAEAFQLSLLESEGFGRTIAVAVGLASMQEAITDETVAALKVMENSPMGFKTDRQGGYDTETIKSCAIRALVHGATLHGNEFNIIAGNCYLTQEYYMRKCREYPGVANVRVQPGIPESAGQVGKNTIMKIGGSAACIKDGVKVHVEFEGDQRLVVSSFQGDYDQAKGKAKKRMAQALYEMLIGVTIDEDMEETGSVQVLESPKTVVAVSSEPEPEPVVTEYEAVASNAGAVDEPINWKAELLSHGGKESSVYEIGELLRDAPSEDDRQAVLRAASRTWKPAGLISVVIKHWNGMRKAKHERRTENQPGNAGRSSGHSEFV